MKKNERIQAILEFLPKNYPYSKSALDFNTPEELLFATILSAQCTDERVNIVTKSLFKKYPDAFAMALAEPAELEEVIRSTGFFRAKAKSLIHTSKELVEKFGGKVPRDMVACCQLRGVGRKTANVVLGNAYGLMTGIAVDTHVGRLSYRLGLTRSDNPIQIEKDLIKFVPQKDWVNFSHWLIDHGRKICKARKPLCSECFLNPYCPQKGVVPKTV